MPLNELHFILFMAETSIRQVPDVLAVNVHNKKVKKSKSKGNRKAEGKGKAQVGNNSAPKSLNLGKMAKAHFNKVNEMIIKLLALVHTDVCGPIGTRARGEYLYFIIFIDNFSRYDYVFLMRHKSESLKIFKEFQNEVEN
jgi:hypothetical protein